jgi:hypothetical protein
VQRQVVGCCIDLFQLRQLYSLFAGHWNGDKRIMCNDLHLKGFGPPCYLHANPAQAHNAQRLAAQFRALK